VNRTTTKTTKSGGSEAGQEAHAALLAERDAAKELLLATQRAAIAVAEERDALRAVLVQCPDELELCARALRDSFAGCSHVPALAQSRIALANETAAKARAALALTQKAVEKWSARTAGGGK
jgi:hypothetical protein